MGRPQQVSDNREFAEPGDRRERRYAVIGDGTLPKIQFFEEMPPAIPANPFRV
jgi:hypothetical protein